MPLETELILAVASFIGAIVGSAATIWATTRNAERDRKEQRRKEQTQYIHDAIKYIVQMFEQYEQLLQTDESDPQIRPEYRSKHALLIGRIIAEILVVSNPRLFEIATKRLTPNMTTEVDDPDGYAAYGDFKTRNRNAIIEVLQELGEMQAKLITGSDNVKVNGR